MHSKRTTVLVVLSFIIAILYLTGLSLIYIAESFRMVFLTWPFFAIMSIGSQLLVVAFLVLHIVYRNALKVEDRKVFFQALKTNHSNISIKIHSTKLTPRIYLQNTPKETFDDRLNLYDQ